MAVLLLEQIQALSATVDIVAGVVPRVVRIMFIRITPSICEIYFPTFWSDIGEGVEDVRQFVSW